MGLGLVLVSRTIFLNKFTSGVVIAARVPAILFVGRALEAQLVVSLRDIHGVPLLPAAWKTSQVREHSAAGRVQDAAVGGFRSMEGDWCSST